MHFEKSKHCVYLMHQTQCFKSGHFSTFTGSSTFTIELGTRVLSGCVCVLGLRMCVWRGSLYRLQQIAIVACLNTLSVISPQVNHSFPPTSFPYQFCLFSLQAVLLGGLNLVQNYLEVEGEQCWKRLITPHSFSS